MSTAVKITSATASVYRVREIKAIDREKRLSRLARVSRDDVSVHVIREMR